MLLKTAYKMKPPPSVRIKPGEPLADKLIACYLLNEPSGLTAFDSARKHHGTLKGGATRTIGKYSRAVDLDGTDGHIEVPDHVDFSPVGTPFSISALVNMHTAADFRVATKYVTAIGKEWMFGCSGSGTLYWACYDEDASAHIGQKSSSALTAFANKWIHLVATYDGGTLSSGLKMYLNTVPIASADYESGAFVAVEDLAVPIRIGKCDVSNYADGLFDNIMFWRRVLTQSDVNRLYARSFRAFDKRGKR